MDPRPRVHKALQNQDQDPAQVKKSLTMDFCKTYKTYLTIDCWYLIQCVLQTRLLEVLSFFMKEKVNFIVVTIRPLINKIHFITVNCLQHVL